MCSHEFPHIYQNPFGAWGLLRPDEPVDMVKLKPNMSVILEIRVILKDPRAPLNQEEPSDSSFSLPLRLLTLRLNTLVPTVMSPVALQELPALDVSLGYDLSVDIVVLAMKLRIAQLSLSDLKNSGARTSSVSDDGVVGFDSDILVAIGILSGIG